MGRALALSAVAFVSGCGDVHFIPSPFTPQNVEMFFSLQEDITVVRWRLSSTAPGDTRFEMLGPSGYQPIAFETSVFAGGVVPCGDDEGSCAQYVVRGRYEPEQGTRPIRAVHPLYGPLPGGIPEFTVMSETLTMKSFFRVHNDLVYVNIEDRVASGGPHAFPRPYERAMWATTGLCVSEAAPDGVGFSPLDASSSFPPETPLTENGIYCVATRPRPADAGAATLVQTRIATLPEVVTGHHRYRPTVETSPVVYQIILDLDIPVADRCAKALQLIESTVANALVGTTVRKLPTVNLAGGPSGNGCSQVDDRELRAIDIAQAVKQVVVSLPEKHQQFHLLYFNNLDAPLQPKLAESFRALFDALSSPPGYDLYTLRWLFNPGAGAIPDLGWWKVTPWLTADDPAFDRALREYASAALPYMSQFHDVGDPVQFVTDAEAAAHDGHRIKICSSSPSVQPLAVTNPPQLPQAWTWTIDGDDPPSYIVALPTQIAAPASWFFEARVDVDYQICARWCTDHPYLNPSGSGVLSWTDSPDCASEDD
jgi:hypothetical protein